MEMTTRENPENKDLWVKAGQAWVPKNGRVSPGIHTVLELAVCPKSWVKDILQHEMLTCTVVGGKNTDLEVRGVGSSSISGVPPGVSGFSRLVQWFPLVPILYQKISQSFHT